MKLEDFDKELQKNYMLNEIMTRFACEIAEPFTKELIRLGKIMESKDGNDYAKILFNLIEKKISDGDKKFTVQLYNMIGKVINWYKEEIANYGDPMEAGWLGFECASVRLFRDKFEKIDRNVLCTLSKIWYESQFNKEQHSVPFTWQIPDMDNDIDVCKGIWKNPFKTNEEYEKYIRGNLKMISALKSLKGKSIGCNCDKKRTHSKVLIDLYKEFYID